MHYYEYINVILVLTAVGPTERPSGLAHSNIQSPIGLTNVSNVLKASFIFILCYSVQNMSISICWLYNTYLNLGLSPAVAAGKMKNEKWKNVYKDRRRMQNVKWLNL